tara:strand:- start:26261 stop:27199 length:939 start_codon:yes stop_codon:yes gene_type:complete
MYNISHKYKRSFLLLFKLAIVFGAIYFIYKRLATNQLLTITQFKEQLLVLFSTNIWSVLLLFLLTDANWLLEIFKWKTLAFAEKKITFFEAYEQSLSSLTVSIITPNRIGEYGAKALYFKKTSRKNILFLNLIGNLSQLIITLFFGVIGVFYFLSNYKILVPKLNIFNLIFIVAISTILFIFRKKLNFFKIKSYVKQISSKIYIKTLILSLFRYIVFSHQFYFLTLLFGIEANYITIISLVFTMYFIASIIPSLAIFDWAVKGSIAVWLFTFIGVNELTIVTIATLMWVLNFAIPSLIGSIFVLNFKLLEKK